MKKFEAVVEFVDINKVIPYANNTKFHPPEQISLLAGMIAEYGHDVPIVVDSDLVVIKGHGRLLACKKLGMEQVPVIIRSDLSKLQAKAARIADNKVSESEWDMDILRIELEELEDLGFDLELTGFDDFTFDEEEDSSTSDTEEKTKEIHAKLNDRFVVPPFSILDTRQGYWMDRKRTWRSLICDNGESREGTLSESTLVGSYNNGVSLLDPVLSELVNLWFGMPQGKTFDCFAGDSVFGYVSSYLGNSFTGIEIRQEQADLNNQRVSDYSKSKYICDDGRNILNHIEENSQDLLFSCPPYFDLEVYSDLENDASNQGSYQEFIDILDTAFTNAVKCLKDDRFAVVTVGDIRDKKGFYYRFVDDIKDIFKRAGMPLYNEIILVEPIGTLPQRVGRIMQYRKVGKCHQNVLVFFKGDPKKIKELYPEVQCEDFNDFEGGEDA